MEFGGSERDEMVSICKKTILVWKSSRIQNVMRLTTEVERNKNFGSIQIAGGVKLWAITGVRAWCPLEVHTSVVAVVTVQTLFPCARPYPPHFTRWVTRCWLQLTSSSLTLAILVDTKWTNGPVSRAFPAASCVKRRCFVWARRNNRHLILVPFIPLYYFDCSQALSITMFKFVPDVSLMAPEGCENNVCFLVVTDHAERFLFFP